MNTAELIAEVAGKAGLSKNAMSQVLRHITDTVRERLLAGEEVSITDLGKFSVVERAARTVRTPAGETVSKPAHMAPKFSASSRLKNVIAKVD